MAVQVDANQALIERYREVVERGDMEELMRFQDEVISDDYVQEWPQSGERIRGRDNFVAVNARYPAAGRWRFDLLRLVADEGGAASEVAVTDGAVVARAVSFFEVRDGLIQRMTEYWPDPFEAADWRAPWVERTDRRLDAQRAVHAQTSGLAGEEARR